VIVIMVTIVLVTIIVVRVTMLDGCGPNVAVVGDARPRRSIWGMIFVRLIRMILYPLRIVVMPVVVLPIVVTPIVVVAPVIVPVLVPAPATDFVLLSGI
jgi:hypothetical protein